MRGAAGCTGPGSSAPFSSAFLVFQGAILTTMLATRNFSGRCCLWDSSPCRTGYPGQICRVPGELALPCVTERLRLQPCASGDVWLWVLLQERSPGTSRQTAGLGWKRKSVWLRLSDSHFLFVLYAHNHLACSGMRMWVLGTARAQAAGFVSSWSYLWLRESILCIGSRERPLVPLQADGSRISQVSPQAGGF